MFIISEWTEPLFRCTRGSWVEEEEWRFWKADDTWNGDPVSTVVRIAILEINSVFKAFEWRVVLIIHDYTENLVLEPRPTQL